MDDEILDGSLYVYNGNLKPSFIKRAQRAYDQYKADKTTLVNRLKDNERFYRESYSRTVSMIDKKMMCDTPFIFSAIENARSDAIENYPAPNILERNSDGSGIAEKLTKIIPAQLDMIDFKKIYKENMRNKYKYGTSVYGVFYNEETNAIDIRSVDLLDIYVDMHISDIQDSQFVIVSACIDNYKLKEMYPEYKKLFTGDATVETLTDDYKLSDRSNIKDFYYKKADGTMHMFKMCRNTIIAATEDMDDYENGLYDHGMYPFVFDVLYPVEHCPFGFGMIDIGKATQVEINKLDNAITENTIVNAKPRYLTKRSGGVDEEEFKDIQNSVVHYEGDEQSLKPIQTNNLDDAVLTHRETKKDELKELLANRDFQQGATSGGVTAASAIESLQQAGEKRSRAIIDDTYDAYRKIIVMMIEIMRQFYDRKREFRVINSMGEKNFESFSNEDMFVKLNDLNGIRWKPIEFDIDVVPQRENPYTRETMNNTILTLWQSGMFSPQNFNVAVMALKNMNFDGKEQLIKDMQNMMDAMQQPIQQPMMQQGGGVPQEQQVVSGGIQDNAMQQAQTAKMASIDQLPMAITGGESNA